MNYQAPLDDILSALKSAAGLEAALAADLYGGLDFDTVQAVLAEAGRFGVEVLDPLNRPGDKHGTRLVGGTVSTPVGWPEAYTAFRTSGWTALPCPEAFGGQGLPGVLSTAVGEIWAASNLAFSLCPLLTQGAIDAIQHGGSDALKALYLPRMIAGEWTGTMNLTEPQAGSDLAAIRTRAERHADGSYRIFGTKIFITYGEHDLAENIVHLVLARLPDAPPGTRGISLFVVPKRIVGADGSLGAANDVVCAGVEHKLGIHASPTCVMKFGEGEGAVAHLVGEENHGLAVMFVMMNAARLAVGVQGVAIAERATQRAAAYAKERRQGRTASSAPGEMGPIIEHADVRRTLLTMRSLTQAARAICFATARAFDDAHRAADPEARMRAAALGALLTPIAKAFSTDIGCEVASMGVQIHGGMGFVEETGAAQYYRDARILPIYEGTNGIQAIDLVTRKLPLEGGAVMASLISELAATAAEVKVSNRVEFGRLGDRLGEAVAALETATRFMGRQLASGAMEPALAGATPYLRLCGLAIGGHFLAREALDAVKAGDAEIGGAGPVARARFFGDNLLVTAAGLAATVVDGADAILAVEPSALAS